MNQLDNVLASLQEWGTLLFSTIADFLNKYGFYVAIFLVIGAVAKVFNFKIKV